MKKYVETDLKSFISESKKNTLSNDSAINEGCNCGGKKRPNRPTPKNNIPTKKGVYSSLNEQTEIKKQIAKINDDIKNHEFCAILESTFKDSTKIALMVNEGVSENTASNILVGYKRRINFINKKTKELNESFEMIEEDMDDAEEYDFKDRRDGKLETGIYDNAHTTTDLMEDSATDEFETDDDSELDTVGSEVEISTIRITATDVKSAIEELGALGIKARPYNSSDEDDVNGIEDIEDDVTDIDGSDTTDIETDVLDTDIDDGGEVEIDTNIEESVSELDDDIDTDVDNIDTDVDDIDTDVDMLDDDVDVLDDDTTIDTEDNIEEEGDIEIDVSDWTDEEYEKLTSWLEDNGVDVSTFFGGDSNVSIEDDIDGTHVE